MEENYKIPYRFYSEYQPVDIKSLRPNKAYDHLIDHRDYPIKSLIKEFGEIPSVLLKSGLPLLRLI